MISLTVLLIGGGLAIFIAGTLIPGIGVLLIIGGGLLVTFGLGQVGALVLIDVTPPNGRRLLPNEAPELHNLVNRLRQDLVVPPLSDILLTDDFNASIVQHPRLGIFGWPKQWLILGVPLLLAASPQEIASVLAHECGHLSKKHGRDGNRIHRMHRSWEQLFVAVRQNSGSRMVRIAGSLLAKFLVWYWPRFHARAFLLSRQNEFQVDRIAADSTNPEVTASALWRIECTGRLLENDFWKSVWNNTETQSEPPPDLCKRLRQAFANAPQSENARRWCDCSLNRVCGNEDSHPSLADRLRALDVSPEELHHRGFPVAPIQTAADFFLGSDCRSLEAYVNEYWATKVKSIWRDRHRRVVAIRRLTADSEQNSDGQTLTAAELWEQTRRIMDVQGLEAAEPQLRRVLSRQADHVGATFALGQLRLAQGHPDAEDLLSHVVSLQHREWTQPAGYVLERHFAATGQRDQARELRLQLDAFEKSRADAEKERSNIRRSDVFVAHGLTSSEMKSVTAALLKHEYCLEAWLVQKQLKHFPEEKLFVLSVDSNKHAGDQRVKRNDRMITALMLNVELPGRLFVVTPTSEFKSVAVQIMKDSNWKIFDRSESSPTSNAFSEN